MAWDPHVYVCGHDASNSSLLELEPEKQDRAQCDAKGPVQGDCQFHPPFGLRSAASQGLTGLRSPLQSQGVPHKPLHQLSTAGCC